MITVRNCSIVAGFFRGLFRNLKSRYFGTTTRPVDHHSVEPPVRDVERAANSLKTAELHSSPQTLYQACPMRSSDSFRLLVIYPGLYADKLRGELLATNFARRPTYDALSYTWADGTGDDAKPCEFSCETLKSTIPITKNCDAAIRRLRRPDKARRVWIDAICIDQANTAERNHQVSLMARIYQSASRVVAYVGEGTSQTDALLGWVNQLPADDLWSAGIDELAEEPTATLKLLWDSVPAVKALTLLSLVHEHASASVARVFVLVQKRVRCDKSHLLDVLIETRGREATDPRDKIFGLLSLADMLDGGQFSSQLKADYNKTTEAVYTEYSEFFIRHHGPAFFLSLIKTPPPGERLPGLPSWAADWSTPTWINDEAVRAKDYAAVSHTIVYGMKDGGARFRTAENGQRVLEIDRPRILRGYFTRDAHLDDSRGLYSSELVTDLGESEILIRMYPGLSALLKRRDSGDGYIFLQTCPHALSELSMREISGQWCSVVVNGAGPTEGQTEDYLGPVQSFRIY
ncbi:Heterokaryon incompatibility protein 6, OR allele [Madurella mycetomatis]|uniref:Heterokaryon incompatibility protein 6, OR allele n=1 Tax=Madurella mycetomatis TaxID=100816 RepID=A0A175WCT7_9PEZI|nr:Heterokaryon incompatibility protein 6, OR allele [Madurella mycetomatis]